MSFIHYVSETDTFPVVIVILSNHYFSVVRHAGPAYDWVTM